MLACSSLDLHTLTLAYFALGCFRSSSVRVCKCKCRSVSVEVSVFKGFSGRTLRNAFGKKRKKQNTHKRKEHKRNYLFVFFRCLFASFIVFSLFACSLHLFFKEAPVRHGSFCPRRSWKLAGSRTSKKKRRRVACHASFGCILETKPRVWRQLLVINEKHGLHTHDMSVFLFAFVFAFVFAFCFSVSSLFAFWIRFFCCFC